MQTQEHPVAHEVWASSDGDNDAVIFSSLDEEARLLMVSGRIWHAENATPQEVFDATVRYIRSVKIVASADLHAVLRSFVSRLPEYFPPTFADRR